MKIKLSDIIDLESIVDIIQALKESFDELKQLNISDVIQENKTKKQVKNNLSQLKKMNNKKINAYKVMGYHYILDSDLNLDDINFPSGIHYEIDRYGNDTLQVLLFLENNVEFGVLNCKMTHDMINKKKEKKQEVNEMKRKEQEPSKDLLRYLDYRKTMIENGADEKLFELEAVNQIIMHVIENGDPIVKSQGRSPIYYKDPNTDGTFDIYGRMNGQSVSVIYKMQYCNDNNQEHYIMLKKYWKLEEQQISQLEIIDENGEKHKVVSMGYKTTESDNIIKIEDIYINKDGNVVEVNKKDQIKGTHFNSLISDLKELSLINS